MSFRRGLLLGDHVVGVVGMRTDDVGALYFFFFQAEDGIRDKLVTGVQTCAFRSLRTLRLAAWLGWQLETNWASPWLFALYMLVKPVCGSLMLVGMFYAADQAAKAGAVPAIGRAGIAPEFLPYMYVSNACY